MTEGTLCILSLVGLKSQTLGFCNLESKVWGTGKGHTKSNTSYIFSASHFPGIEICALYVNFGESNAVEYANMTTLFISAAQKMQALHFQEMGGHYCFSKD